MGNAIVLPLWVVPGPAGVFLLLVLGGFTRAECFLQITRLSKKGAFFLVLTVTALALILPFGQWIGWDWVEGLIAAPKCGFSRALLPGSGIARFAKIIQE